jgi:hypothetical protein
LVLADSWWNRTDFGEVAEYSFTGTLTSPKLIAPLQIARGIDLFYPQSVRLTMAGRRFAG